MKSAQISTSTSAIMNSLMFSQKPLRMLAQLSRDHVPVEEDLPERAVVQDRC